MSEIALAARTLLGLVFLAAALGKARHRLAFQGVLANYRLLPDFALVPMALTLPPLEAAVGATLLCSPSPWPQLAAVGLLTVFASAMAINIARGRHHIDCGCFQSALKQSLSWTLVARNMALVALLAWLLAARPSPATGLAAAEGLLTGAVLFLLLQSLNVLWSVTPAWRQRHPVHAELSK
jgi:hypothetical protein